MAKDEKKTFQPDLSREMGPDLRDPRCKGWPCHSDHQPGKSQGNKWAKWTHCTKCGLRVSYTPSMGAPSNSMQVFNPEMVRRALNDLKDNLPKNVEPTEELVQLFIDKETAEIRIEHIMEEAKRDLAKNMEKVAKAAAAAKMSAKPKPKIKMKASQLTQPSEGYVEAVPTSSTSSWQDIPQEPPAEFNPMDHLTEAEKKHIMDLAASRVQVVHDSEEEMEPASGNP